MSVLVVVPTYNELENLKVLVSRLRQSVPEADLLIVDDSSPDGTGALADALAAADGAVHVLHRTVKDGLGRAYIAGFSWALERGYDRVIQMDADLSHDPAYLPALLAASQAYDLVLGSRYIPGVMLPTALAGLLVARDDAAQSANVSNAVNYITIPGGGTVNWGLGRRLLSRGGSLYARTILGLPLRDLTGGFRCWRRHVLEDIQLGSVRSNGYSFQIEMTYRAVLRGHSVTEVPIVFADRVDGQTKMSKKIVVEAIGMVWKLRLRAATIRAARPAAMKIAES
jgi:dolichol-phosphate mannosyltransferase